ncbi:hypothetical protein E0W68_10385 [Flavobacterium salilacus subsp. salilacus]|uniref:DUF6702 family protein n=1 Tax=Flavobacterium TaxID=237 RepID=UPI001074B27B|nr:MULTISPECIES: DUF6702 family protein [Flavobacterium]KAF2518137.1 hypothetical protein E0W68_10385 [Flavobacterium salilacus subsp. salilacus]MBE1615553.1 hypothetical protein [Flavobacterium sp. SaA2.13]
MKQIARFIFLTLILFSLSAADVHKFYVAIFQMDYIPEKNVIQMTSRVFTDDLELAFEKKYNKKFYLATSREISETKQYLEMYFAEKITVTVNGTVQPIKYLGKEIEDDVLVCYYTIPTPDGVTTINIKNTTLFDMYAEQQNMIHTNINDNKKSLLLTLDKPEGILEY